MPRLEELETFCKVIEHKSFSRAAEMLGLSQPAVSQQIKALEAEYGSDLLYRQGLEVIPTEGGRLVYEFACEMIERFERSRQQVRELAGRVEGRLLIGASSGPGEHFIPILLGRFKAQYPEVRVALRVGDSRIILDAIFNHQLELGFVGSARRDRYLAFEPFLHDELILVVAPAHPWTKRSAITYPELLEAPLILQQQGSGATMVLQDALSEQGISLADLNVTMELGLQDSAKAAVRAGFGVTLISKLGVKEELERGDLVQVRVEDLHLQREIFLCYNRSLPLSNLAKTFLVFAGENKEILQP